MKTLNAEIIFENGCLIGDIQHQFNLLYPFLKIEFLKQSGHASGKHVKLPATHRIIDASGTCTSCVLNVDKDRTIAQIADDCMQKLGLSLQVLRKSGNVWNLISITDSWTLENQNNAARFISSEMNTPAVNAGWVTKKINLGDAD